MCWPTARLSEAELIEKGAPGRLGNYCRRLGCLPSRPPRIYTAGRQRRGGLADRQQFPRDAAARHAERHPPVDCTTLRSAYRSRQGGDAGSAAQPVPQPDPEERKPCCSRGPAIRPAAPVPRHFNTAPRPRISTAKTRQWSSGLLEFSTRSSHGTLCRPDPATDGLRDRRRTS